jgi:hypothetical protein
MFLPLLQLLKHQEEVVQVQRGARRLSDARNEAARVPYEMTVERARKRVKQGEVLEGQKRNCSGMSK